MLGGRKPHLLFLFHFHFILLFYSPLGPWAPLGCPPLGPLAPKGSLDPRVPLPLVLGFPRVPLPWALGFPSHAPGLIVNSFNNNLFPKHALAWKGPGGVGLVPWIHKKLVRPVGAAVGSVFSPQHLVPGTLYLVPGTWYEVPGTRYLGPAAKEPGTRYLVPDTWYQVPGARNLVPGTWYQVPGTTWYQVQGTSPSDYQQKQCLGSRAAVMSTPRLLLVNLGFWISRCEICSKNMLVEYRGINNKGVLDRPWTKWMV